MLTAIYLLPFLHNWARVKSKIYHKDRSIPTPPIELKKRLSKILLKMFYIDRSMQGAAVQVVQTDLQSETYVENGMGYNA